MIKQLLLAVFTLCSIIVTAQTPQAINYQAVARTVDGKIIPVQPVNVRFTIRNTTTTGTILYQENHLTTTNSYGLFTLAIGTGTNTTGNFSTIDWGTGFKYLTVEFASNSTTNYTIMGTTQLLSVPYALYSEKTKLIAGAGITITNGNIITATSAGLVYTGTNGVQVTGTVISGAYTAGNAINITGSTIAANYVGSNGVAVTGNSITGAYTAGNAINITGSTIAANYVGSNGVAVTGNSITGAYTAGTGIGISGGVISNTLTSNGWQLLGNGGTNPTNNFIGTTDAQSLSVRVNSVERLRLEPPSGAVTTSALFVGSAANPNTSLYVYGKDIVGSSLPSQITNDITGQSYGASTGQTLGRLTRLFSIANSGNSFYDIGISPNTGNLYFTTKQTGGSSIDPNKMLVLGSNGVGLNMTAQGSPTAAFHNIGTVRLESLPIGTGINLVVDANGNVFKSSTFSGRTTDVEISELKKEVEVLKQMILELKAAQK